MNTILHLGLGSFHRAHQAVYLHRLRETGDLGWSIVGANIRNDMAETMAALIAQNGAYTLETVSPNGKRDYEWIGAIRKVIPFDASHPGARSSDASDATGRRRETSARRPRRDP